MSDAPLTTAREDRVRFTHKLAYGLGSFVNNMLAAASGNLMFVLNLGYGMNPALVGLLGGIPRLTDALTDPIMGFISDHTKTRWGRRRPYIFAGAILAPLILVLIWNMPDGQTQNFYFFYVLILLFVFFLAYTVFATPWVALGYELTPDYNERTKLMGVQNFLGQGVWLLAPYFFWFMQLDVFDDLKEGAASLAVVIAVVCVVLGVVPAIVLRERFSKMQETDSEDAKAKIVSEAKSTLAGVLNAVTEFLQGFKTTVKNKDFLLLAGATFLVFNGFQMIASFQLYVVTFYVFEGDQDKSALLLGNVGVVGSISTFAAIAIATYLSTYIGKRRAFFVCISISAVGYALKWICYNPEMPWLLFIPAPLMAFGLGALFVLMGSMIADVCDEDELSTRERREGMYGSMFWWVIKLGMSAALMVSGYLLNFTGFDVDLPAQTEETLFWMRVYDVLIPTASSLVAIWLVYKYSITEEKALQTRQQLEQRRGVLPPAG